MEKDLNRDFKELIFSLQDEANKDLMKSWDRNQKGFEVVFKDFGFMVDVVEVELPEIL